jgi:hypothetical protein
MARSAFRCFLGLALAAAGCNEDPGADNRKGDGEPSTLPPESACPAYPSPPFGVTRGSSINPFSFQGFVDPVKANSTLQTIEICDFYNPRAGDPTYQPATAAEDVRLFPPGSLYGGGTKKPTALLIDIASVWCGPCNEEAKMVLNGLYAKYKPCGGEFLFQLAEGAAPGTLATEQALQAWTTMYEVPYPSTFDPARQLFPLYNADSFPDSAIVDTKTMQIVDVISGVPDDRFWAAYEALLDPGCLAQQH